MDMMQKDVDDFFSKASRKKVKMVFTEEVSMTDQEDKGEELSEH